MYGYVNHRTCTQRIEPFTFDSPFQNSLLATVGANICKIACKNIAFLRISRTNSKNYNHEISAAETKADLSVQRR